MKRPPVFMSRRRAFSLSEILCALGVLATLAVLLVPAVDRMRGAAQSTYCINNLRQIGVALLGYTNDNNGRLIPAASLGGSPQRYWFDALDDYMGEEPDNFDRDRPHAWQLCPAKPVRPENRTVVGYGWNHRNFGYTLNDTSYGPNARLSEVSRPAETIIIADSVDITGNEALPGTHEHRYLYANQVAKLAKRHSGRGNYLMLDGHVATYRPEDVYEGSTEPSRLFWRKR
jgi:prepilin-type processing-associated H-X9-DG protein